MLNMPLNEKDTYNKRNNYQVKAFQHSCCERNLQKTREAHVETELGLITKVNGCFCVTQQARAQIF